MSARSSAVPFHTARRLAWEAASALPVEEVPLVDAVGRMLARDVIALADVPHYASSAMDGWAVAGAPPWTVTPTAALATGGATAIVTGGLVPDGADAVLRSEHGDIADGILTPSVVPSHRRHIRPAGEEARRGEVVIRAGMRLNPVQVAVAAGCGLDSVAVARRPRIGLVFTGSEVITSGLPDAGRVRDSFDPLLAAVLEDLGGVVVSRVRIADDRAALFAALSRSDVDILITTGGTGDSPVDHVRPAITGLGGVLVIDGLAVRPGAPTVLARLPSGALLVGLPGNPLAAVTGLLTLTPPLIARMQQTDLPPLESVPVGEHIRGSSGRSTLLPYRLTDGAAVRCSRTGSGMLRGLAEADGILIVPEDGIAAGDPAEVLPLPWCAASAS